MPFIIFSENTELFVDLYVSFLVLMSFWHWIFNIPCLLPSFQYRILASKLYCKFLTYLAYLYKLHNFSELLIVLFHYLLFLFKSFLAIFVWLYSMYSNLLWNFPKFLSILTSLSLIVPTAPYCSAYCRSYLNL